MNKVLIFGGAGSLGTELVIDYLKKFVPVVVVSRDEAKHWELKNKLTSNQGLLRTQICDVRDARRVSQVIRDENPNTIIIAQALKQVVVCEEQPSESIDTNIFGVRNILDAIDENCYRVGNEIANVCFVSTDKACNPINVYGMSKSISEKMVLAASKKNPRVKFVVTRYGNVLNSKGSIIPLFLKQAEFSDCFTVTDPRMTRFMMLLEESVELINKAIVHGKTGDIWIPKIDSFLIDDLSNYFSKKYNKPIKNIGIRPGEKIHEVLMSESEYLYSEFDAGCLVVNDRNMLRKGGISEYSSKDCLISYEKLSERLDEFLINNTYKR